MFSFYPCTIGMNDKELSVLQIILLNVHVADRLILKSHPLNIQTLQEDTFDTNLSHYQSVHIQMAHCWCIFTAQWKTLRH